MKILIEIHCEDHSCTLFNNTAVIEVIMRCLFSLKEGFKPYTQCHKFKCLSISCLLWVQLGIFSLNRPCML